MSVYTTEKAAKEYREKISRLGLLRVGISMMLMVFGMGLGVVGLMLLSFFHDYSFVDESLVYAGGAMAVAIYTVVICLMIRSHYKIGSVLANLFALWVMNFAFVLWFLVVILAAIVKNYDRVISEAVFSDGFFTMIFVGFLLNFICSFVLIYKILHASKILSKLEGKSESRLGSEK